MHLTPLFLALIMYIAAIKIISAIETIAMISSVIIYYFLTFCERLYSAFNWLFFLIIKNTKMPTIAAVIAQPSIGIQVDVKFAPVNNVPKKYVTKPTVKPTANCKPMPAKSHFLSLISAFIAPIAAKHGGEKRLNIKNASAATLVIPIMAATSAAPLSKTKSSTLIKFVMP